MAKHSNLSFQIPSLGGEWGSTTAWTGVVMSTHLPLRIDFLIHLNSMRKFFLGGGELAFASFPLVYNSLISCSRLVCVAYKQPNEVLFLRYLEYSLIYVLM